MLRAKLLRASRRKLAKLAQHAASAGTAPLSAKEPAKATITTGSGNHLTAAEHAKLEEFLSTLVTLPVPFMPKLKLMQVPTEGIPVLTEQEREKHV